MMHRCCGGSHVMGTCTCGMYHTETNSSYSMMYGHGPYDDYDHDVYSSSSSFTPSPSSVDCTLSLGTPSTRFTEDEEKRHRNHRRSSVTNFCWDLLQSKQSQTKSSSRGNSNNNNNNNSNNNNNDSLLARRCANCDTTSTPLWRNGPRGPKSLCNACGIRYKKEERRASAAAAATSSAGSGGVYGHHHNNSWYAHSQNQKMSNELRFMDDSDRDSENNGIPFLSWKLNVADRTSLVHDFTR